MAMAKPLVPAGAPLQLGHVGGLQTLVQVEQADPFQAAVAEAAAEHRRQGEVLLLGEFNLHSCCLLYWAIESCKDFAAGAYQWAPPLN